MRTPFLNGRGVLLAVLDSGITWDQEVFRKADGSTRIRYLWDQTVLRDRTLPQDRTVPEKTGNVGYGKKPDGFAFGTEYTAEEINAALQMPALDRYRRIPSRDLSGHGTAVGSPPGKVQVVSIPGRPPRRN